MVGTSPPWDEIIIILRTHNGELIHGVRALMMQGPTIVSRSKRAKDPLMADSTVYNQEDPEKGTVSHLHPSQRTFSHSVGHFQISAT